MNSPDGSRSPAKIRVKLDTGTEGYNGLHLCGGLPGGEVEIKPLEATLSFFLLLTKNFNKFNFTHYDQNRT